MRQFVLHRAALESLPVPLSGDEERRSRQTQEFHEQRSGCVGVYRFAFRGTTSRPAVVAIPDYWVRKPGQTVKCLGGSQGQWHRGWQADLGKIGIYARLPKELTCRKYGHLLITRTPTQGAPFECLGGPAIGC
jgi:hypothetical protein